MTKIWKTEESNLPSFPNSRASKYLKKNNGIQSEKARKTKNKNKVAQKDSTQHIKLERIEETDTTNTYKNVRNESSEKWQTDQSNLPTFLDSEVSKTVIENTALTETWNCRLLPSHCE